MPEWFRNYNGDNVYADQTFIVTPLPVLQGGEGRTESQVNIQNIKKNGT